jgi:type IX secretion system PorP/SprF family membrane protein
MKKILLSLVGLFFLSIGNISAQQLPHYTQYMYNMNILNPAYAGSKGPEVISFGTLYRSQWHNAPGAPQTLTANVHGAINDNNGLGLSFINDKYGPVKQDMITFDYSHTLNFGKTNLAFGLKAGLQLFNVNNDFYVIHPGDPVFAQDIKDTNLNIGAGVFYYSDKYYLSVSVPNFLQNKYNDGNGYESSDEIHLFVAGGYVFDLSKDFKLKPHFLLFNNISQPFQADISLNMLYANRFEFGVSYRLQDAASAMFGIKLFDNLRLGYSYDIHISDISYYSAVSHEFFLNYDWALSKKVMLSPRYF